MNSKSTENDSSSGEIEDGVEVQFPKLFTILKDCLIRKLCYKFINHNITF